MKNKQDLVNKILIQLDSGRTIVDGWKFRYNSKVQGIEAYNESKSIIEKQNFYNDGGENFKIVVERLLDKIYF